MGLVLGTEPSLSYWTPSELCGGRTPVLQANAGAMQAELDGGALSFSVRSLRAGIAQAPPCISQCIIWTELEALFSLN